MLAVWLRSRLWQVNSHIHRLLARDRQLDSKDAAAGQSASASSGPVGGKGGDKSDDGLRTLLALTKHSSEATRVGANITTTALVAVAVSVS